MAFNGIKITVLTAALAACGPTTSTDPTQGPQIGTGTDGAGDTSSGGANQPGGATTVASPSAVPDAVQVATDPTVQAQVAGSALDSVGSAAATGASGAGSVASLVLSLTAPSNVALADGPVITAGALATDCYLGSHVGSSRENGLTWPEATTGAFADSKNDPGDATGATMYVEPALLVAAAVNDQAAATMTLSVPYKFSELVEVIQTDTRQATIQLADARSTHEIVTANDNEHRFWVAKQGPTGAASSAMACTPTTSSGDSGKADGKFALVKWKDDSQVGGLNLLTRFTRAGTSKESYAKTTKADSFGGTLDTTFSAIGERLVQWATSTAALTTVPGATVVRQKTVTHAYHRVDQVLTGTTVASDVSAFDEVRASEPLVIDEYRNDSEVTLAHIVQSGSVLKTGTSANGDVRWFSKFTYKAVEFDLINSSEPCIPVSGSVTMTTFAKEGGSQVGQITITYSSTPATAGGGQVDPQIAVTGAVDNDTSAQWMMVHVNRHCDLRQVAGK